MWVLGYSPVAALLASAISGALSRASALLQGRVQALPVAVRLAGVGDFENAPAGKPCCYVEHGGD
jgi:hypothetical protein